MTYSVNKFNNVLMDNNTLFHFKSIFTGSLALTQEQLGHRLAELRKMKGLSQQELSEFLKISRSSLAKIESGSRTLSALELHRIALVFDLSVDEFLSMRSITNKDEGAFVDVKSAGDVITQRPVFQLLKFESVLLYIMECCAGKPNIGETVLCKLLYFSDFNYYELYNEYLTGVSYLKYPYGPMPVKFGTILLRMMADNKIQRLKCKYQGYAQTRYIPLQKADLTLLKASEKEVVDRVLDQLSHMTAAAISAYSHGDIPWQVSRDGAEIEYELAFARKPPYSARVYQR